jgi:hypothetical protein
MAFAGATFVGLMLGGVVIAGNQRALWATGETWPLDEVVAYQSRTGAVFQRQYSSPETIPAYKFHGLLRLQPDVAVLGSSRVAAIRGALFGKRWRFFNAAGLAQSLGDVQAFLDRVPKEKTPRVVVLGVDLWWFDYDWPLAAASWNNDPDAGWLSRGSRLASIALRPWLVFGNPSRTGQPAVGLAAVRSGEGFRADGSLARSVRPDRHNGKLPFADPADPPAVDRVKGSSHEFAGADALSRERIERLKLLLRQFYDRGVLVIGLAPPLSTAAGAAMAVDPGHKEFWREVRSSLTRSFRDAGFPYVDASDPRSVGLNDTYLFDGLQAGEVFWVNVFERVAEDPRVERSLPGLATQLRRLKQGAGASVLHLGPALEASVHK